MDFSQSIFNSLDWTVDNNVSLWLVIIIVPHSPVINNEQKKHSMMLRIPISQLSCALFAAAAAEEEKEPVFPFSMLYKTI